MTRRYDTAGAAPVRHGPTGGSPLRGLPVQPHHPAETAAVSRERTLDDLLATIERSELSPAEIRVLLWLAEHEATAGELTDALEERARAITSVVYRLAMRGLIRRRFDRGQRSGFVFGITPAGRLALRPLLHGVTDAGPAAGEDCP